jgi:hypothetical protein
VRLTTSSCKKKFVENLLRKKNARRGQGSMGCGATDDDDDDDGVGIVPKRGCLLTLAYYAFPR